MSLLKQKCTPCRGDDTPLDINEQEKLLNRLNQWTLSNDKITKKFEFKNFNEALDFTNKVADLAEKEDHHPDMNIHYKEVTVSVWTYAINGLLENDFVLAAKIDKIYQEKVNHLNMLLLFN
ncbi:4a-hydroxytetrahydrobiopterin dehydratase [candidate division KSB1 bacterium]